VALTADDQLNGEGYRMVERAGRVDGKVAIVTGVGSTPGPGIGTGKATAVVLAREGASVLLVDLHADRADETRRMIEDERGTAQVFGTPGTGWDVGWAAAFLASDEARWITGVTLPVDSGVLSVTPLMMAQHLRAVPEPIGSPGSH
jgi:NAD(P)-dependent dehydrogenase (short-subunit alcohol dehydrogenase family)